MKSLYPKILGSSWDELHPTVQALHRFHDGVFAARGSFQVRHGPNIFSRALAWLLRMPPAHEGVQVRLTVRELEGGERWVREFDGKLYPSQQYLINGDAFGEQVGPLEIRFRLEVKAGCLIYRVQSIGFRLFHKSIPMPKWLSPKIHASECPGPSTGTCKIQVGITLPFFGILLEYNGILNWNFL